MGLAEFTGPARFRRRFGYPGRIDGHERVWLTMDEIGNVTEIRLNDRVLRCGAASAGAFERDVTELLQARNELVIEVEGCAEQGSLWGEAALEVRCTAFLRGLRRFALVIGERAELHVAGEVAGTADRPLELYVLLNRSVAGYQVVTARAEGQPFEIVVPDVAVANRGGAVVQVDLVNGAVVWYTSEAEVRFEPAVREDG